MSDDRLVIIGAGGFGREVAEIARAARGRQSSIAMADDHPSSVPLSLLDQNDIIFLGTIQAWTPQPGDTCIIAVGDPHARERLAARLAARGADFDVLVHPSSTIARSVVIGAGSVVAAGARISTDVSIGEHVHVDQNATVAHDSTVSAYARVNPSACISGNVHVGTKALVGANATVLQGLAVGDSCVVGAGAVVVSDVQPRTVVKGVPAR